MDKQNDMAQLRYLEEAAISLKRAGFDTGRIEDRHLPVSWNGSYLCRISGKGSILYRQQNVDANGVQAELQNVIDIAKTTSEYMAMMERAPQLKARDLEGDYSDLAFTSSRLRLFSDNLFLAMYSVFADVQGMVLKVHIVPAQSGQFSTT